MNKKYAFTGEEMEFEGKILRRILYIKDVTLFSRKGEVGGWIEGEHNLSHEGDCAVLGNAKVFGNASIQETSCVKGEAIIKDNVIVKGKALVLNNSIVGADTIIGGSSWIQGNSKVFFYNVLNNKTLLENISGSSEIKSTTIESTGFIIDSCIIQQEIEGPIEIDTEYIVD